jgi:hypothetical protein
MLGHPLMMMLVMMRIQFIAPTNFLEEDEIEREENDDDDMRLV